VKQATVQIAKLFLATGYQHSQPLTSTLTESLKKYFMSFNTSKTSLSFASAKQHPQPPH